MCKCPGVQRHPKISICWYDKPFHTYHCFISGGIYCCCPNEETDKAWLDVLWWLACILTSPMALMLALLFGFCCTPDNCRTYCECREEEPGALTRCDEYWCCIAV
ncbi:uncharacterized protein ACA1_365850 [Acanthamoeba castellanii str. Neff]|uniref:Uncharacterized protein n=1 Tax=Acanthamoeba castellanii (strain ATCC 30010 / Neff) TaxID=1257118 RepID=L8GME0_ACACF|nr:uncharacterized protein ACA1_365850 [Acanthamoeba castellanii str. Neff]ELR13994.1 hypothetical protein ACA1_365850 [Acanthamoeba castellanii str. Neff]